MSLPSAWPKRIERAVVDIGQSGDVAYFVLSRQHHLTGALSEILPVLNAARIDCRHLDTATSRRSGKPSRRRVALGGGQLKRCGLLAIAR